MPGGCVIMDAMTTPQPSEQPRDTPQPADAATPQPAPSAHPVDLPPRPQIVTIAFVLALVATLIGFVGLNVLGGAWLLGSAIVLYRGFRYSGPLAIWNTLICGLTATTNLYVLHAPEWAVYAQYGAMAACGATAITLAQPAAINWFREASGGGGNPFSEAGKALGHAAQQGLSTWAADAPRRAAANAQRDAESQARVAARAAKKRANEDDLIHQHRVDQARDYNERKRWF